MTQRGSSGVFHMHSYLMSPLEQEINTIHIRMIDIRMHSDTLVWNIRVLVLNFGCTSSIIKHIDAFFTFNLIVSA